MELINKTPYSALLFRTAPEGDRFASSTIIRVMYNLIRGNATLISEHSWPLSMKPWQSEFGPMERDAVFHRGGIDLFILGRAKSLLTVLIIKKIKPVRN